MARPQRFPSAGAVALVIALSLTASTPPGDAATSSGRPITIDAEDVYLPSILKTLAEKGDLNIITGPGVTGGRISIHMKDVPVEQALNLVVRAAGLSYERIGNSVLVADDKTLKQETGLSSYVVELRYADAKEVQASLKTLSADIQVDPGGNRLVIVTSPRVIAEIEEIVRVIDVPAQQVMLEARIVEVSTDAAKKLGIDWDMISRQAIVIQEGRPAGTSTRGGLPDSINWYQGTGGVKGLFKSKDAWWREGYGWATALDLMIHDGNARVLANPKIATLNGREASMLVGSRIPFVVSGTVFSGGGAAQTQTIQREEVGIKLSITPTINSDGFITTIIKPEVSSVVGFTGPDNSLPIISTRQASTTVRLKDGNSVIIGGLLSEERTKNVTKLPLLGDIPGLGLLFQHQNTTLTKKDLVIEVTPHILPEQR